MIRDTAFKKQRVRGAVDRLAVVFADQLDLHGAALANLDKQRDAILMMEIADASRQPPSHRQRTALFLSAMRHFARELAQRKYRVHYIRLNDADNTHNFDREIARAVAMLKPNRLDCTEPGDWRVREQVESAFDRTELPWEIHEDAHFLVSRAEFAQWMDRRNQPVMEHFYRAQRKKLGVLMRADGKPEGGEWNYDQQNRNALKSAPDLEKPYTPRTDAITREVMALVNEHLPDLPGKLDAFQWPVTRDQARRALDDFITHRLARFGDYQDAMWTGQPLLYHSGLSAALNLKLLNPRECVDAARQAYAAKQAPLNSVEGFVRQLIGWREFIRGIYWHQGPDYRACNALDHTGALPDVYWTGETEMACMHASLGQVIEQGYGHHIQRLMVTGNFALIAGIDPAAVNDWYLGMYVDAVDWVTTPNVIGMALHADGGVVGTKPYVASGKYIQRMSNYCQDCPYDPAQRTGAQACPFTVFFWDFLMRHEARFRDNRRMGMMLKNVERLEREERDAIRQRAREIRIELNIRPS